MCRHANVLIVLSIIFLSGCLSETTTPENPARVDLSPNLIEDEVIDAPDPNLISTEQLEISFFRVAGSEYSVLAEATVTVTNINTEGDFEGLQCEVIADGQGRFQCEISGEVGDKVSIRQSFNGQTSPETVKELLPEILLTDLESHGLAGLSVENAGDVNGDGSPDLIVGSEKGWMNHPSNKYFNENLRVGVAYVYSPRCDGDESECILMRLKGHQPGDGFGSVVNTAGDLNGDGYEDVFVSAPWYEYQYEYSYVSDSGEVFSFETPRMSPGAVYAYAGGPGLGGEERFLGLILPPLDLSFGDSEFKGFFGSALIGGKDLDGDSIPDVLIAGKHDPAGVSGEVFFYSGACIQVDEPCMNPFFSLTQEDLMRLLEFPEYIIEEWLDDPHGSIFGGYFFGQNMEMAEFFADGKTYRLAISAMAFGAAKGKIFLVDLSFEGQHVTPSMGGGQNVISPPACNHSFGSAMTFVKDINDDTRPELVVGISDQAVQIGDHNLVFPYQFGSNCTVDPPEEESSSTITSSGTSSDDTAFEITPSVMTGAILLYPSNSRGKYQVIGGGEQYERLGAAIEYVGDINGDGFEEIAAISAGDAGEGQAPRFSVWSTLCPNAKECNRKLYGERIEGKFDLYSSLSSTQQLAILGDPFGATSSQYGHIYFASAIEDTEESLYDGKLQLVSGKEVPEIDLPQPLSCDFETGDFGFNHDFNYQEQNKIVVSETQTQVFLAFWGFVCAVRPLTTVRIFNASTGDFCETESYYDGSFDFGQCRLTMLTGENLILEYQDSPSTFSTYDTEISPNAPLTTTDGADGETCRDPIDCLNYTL